MASEMGNIFSEGIPLRILERIPIAVACLNEQGDFLFVNDTYLKERGYDREYMLSANIKDINTTMSTKSWRAYWNEVKHSKVKVLESEHITKEGKPFPIHVTSVFVEMEGVEVMCGFIKNLLDVNRYKTLMDLTSHYSRIAGWERDVVSNEFYVTDAFYDIIGHPKEKVIDISNFLEYTQKSMSPEDFERFVEVDRKCNEDFASFEEDFLILRMDGEKMWIRMTGQPKVIDGEIVKIYGTVQDISHHRNFSDDMFLMKFTFDNMSEMVCWVDEEGNFFENNSALLKKTGYSKDNLKSMNIWDILLGMEQNLWEEEWSGLEKSKSKRFDDILIVKDNPNIEVSYSMNFITFDGKQYVCIIMNDMSEQKSKERQLSVAMDKVMSLRKELEQENTYLKSEIRNEYSFRNIISKNESYKKVLSQIEEVAPTDATVLIMGETGTGKELLARAVHTLSERGTKPLIKVNCAALPEHLIESELFGHEKGAFTNAYRQKIGRFELANGGTIFLDEIGEMPLDLQSKLLRVLQEGEFERVGGNKTIKVDVRVIAATNRNLEKKVMQGSFREDLYFRLNVFPVENIPLRKRKDDIPILAQFFLEKFSEKQGKEISGISPSSMSLLQEYDFPGNIRELENIIERSTILCKRKVLVIPSEFLYTKLKKTKDKETGRFKSLDKMQRDYIVKVLRHTKGKVSGDGGAAELLEMNAKTLDSRIRKYKIRKNEYLI